MEEDLNNYMYLHFALSAAAFFMILVYFPKKPPIPPSASSAVEERIDFRRSAAYLAKSPNFWFFLVAYGLPVGFQLTYVSVLDETLRHYGISQDTSNWIGLATSLIGIPASCIFSSISDCNKKLMKPLLIFCMFGSGVGYSCFALMGFGVIPTHIALVYVFLIVASFCTNALTSLGVEFSCEICYPISEEVINGFLTASITLCGGILLGLVMIKDVGTSWVPTGLGGSSLLMIPVMMAVRANYRRLEVDMGNRGTESSDCLLPT